MPKKKAVLAPARKLDDRQEKFCREYLSDFNATRAAKAAGYSEKTARQQGADLMSRPIIQERIRELSKEIVEKVGDPIEKIIDDIRMIAQTDMKDFLTYDEKEGLKWKDFKDVGDKTRIISEFKESYGKSGYSRSFKLHDKLKAAEMYLKLHGLFKETVKHEGEVTSRVVIEMIPNGREKIQ